MKRSAVGCARVDSCRLVAHHPISNTRLVVAASVPTDARAPLRALSPRSLVIVISLSPVVVARATPSRWISPRPTTRR